MKRIKTIAEVDEDMEERSSIWGGASDNPLSKHEIEEMTSYYGEKHEGSFATDR